MRAVLRASRAVDSEEVTEEVATGVETGAVRDTTAQVEEEGSTKGVDLVPEGEVVVLVAEEDLVVVGMVVVDGVVGVVSNRETIWRAKSGLETRRSRALF